MQFDMSDLTLHCIPAFFYDIYVHCRDATTKRVRVDTVPAIQCCTTVPNGT